MRERESERETEVVCVCVCVCEREREREKDARQRHLLAAVSKSARSASDSPRVVALRTMVDRGFSS